MLAFAATLVFAAAAVRDAQTRQQAATTSGYLTRRKSSSTFWTRRP